MKTTRFLATAIFLLTAVSCAKEKADIPQDKDGGTVSLTIQTGQISRAIDDPAVPGTKVEIQAASTTVYFLNNADNVVAARTLSAADETDAATHVYKFLNVPSTAQALYVVCNEGTSHITYEAEKTDLGNIQAGWGAFGPITADYTDLLMSNAKAKAATEPVPGTADNTSDKVALTLAATQPTDGSPAVYEATVSVAPVVARLQLSKITSTGKINSFKLKGIYLDDFYPDFTVAAGAFASTGKAQMAILKDPANLVGFNPAMCDEYTPAVDALADPVVTGNMNVVAGVDKCWAWQVPTGVPSRIILALEDVTVSGNNEGVKYVTVRSYSDDATPPALVTSFTRAKVYSIGELIFDEEDLGDTPNADPITVIATLEVLPWEVINIIPNL